MIHDAFLPRATLLIFFGTDLPHYSLVLRLDYQPLLEIEPGTLIKLDNRAIYTRKNKTRLTLDANFLYKRHISSKIRCGLAKTHLIG